MSLMTIPSRCEYEWRFLPDEDAAIRTIEDCTEVLFNPVFSTGTALVRGNQELSSDLQHYWEFRLNVNIYGSSFMIGVAKGDLLDKETFRHKMEPMLGHDRNSWGLDYTGFIQHGGIKHAYGGSEHRVHGSKSGTTIGIHLDLWRGTLEYYRNGEPLGIAFKNIPTNARLVPVVTSTGAGIQISLTKSVTFKSGLRFEAFRRLARTPDIPLKTLLPPRLWKIFLLDHEFLSGKRDSEGRRIIAADQNKNSTIAATPSIRARYELSSSSEEENYEDLSFNHYPRGSCHSHQPVRMYYCCS